MRFVFTLTIFVSAFLVFLVQPMFARMMLPKLGGAPAVWNTAMLFYQGALLAGYAYAHFAVQKLGTSRQAALHLFLICLPLLVLPIALSPDLSPPQTSNPVLWMLGLMALTVGLPFLIVSTTSPLLQRWFHATGHPQARDPYFLYAASNAGSLLALLAYPTLIEPNLSLETQSRLWSGGYVLLLALLLSCSLLLWNSARKVREGIVAGAEPAAESVGENIAPTRRFRWVLLAFVPSSLMLSVTTYLTTDLAAMPLLWIIPLTLYLLTFILVFASRLPVPHRYVVLAFPILLLPLVVMIAASAFSPLVMVMAFHLVAFFVITLACHGELARDRPHPTQLTEFYLLMSLGGVLGGVFNALVAPLVFRNISEYPVVLVLACFAIIPALKQQSKITPRQLQEEKLDRFLDVALPVVIGAACALFILMCQARGLTSDRYILGVMFGIPALLTFPFSRRALRFGLAIAAIFLASNLRTNQNETVLYSTRSFFGIYRVVQVESTATFHRFVHGSTLHGLQNINPQLAHQPLTYYSESGPLGVAIDSMREKLGLNFDTIGAVGLGVGTVASYAEPHQQWTYYEIDPAVQEIAENPQFFTYLRDSRSPYRIVIGDGRLQMKAAPDAGYDLLIMDAYSSDALPIHLLTREALELYASKLAPGGAMIFNISNRHLDLEPQMAALAQAIGWKALHWDDLNVPNWERQAGKSGSHWVMLARYQSDFGKLNLDDRWTGLQSQENVVAWTDNYSSLLSVFIWK